jgi:hypothetical protein
MLNPSLHGASPVMRPPNTSPAIRARAGRLGSVLLLAWVLCASLPSRSQDSGLQTFTATYAIDWHGITAGYSTLELTPADAGTYTYSSRIRARGVFRLAFPDVLTQTSTFKVKDDRVVPLQYSEGGGSDEVRLHFDWDTGRARGVAQGKSVDQPLQPGTQDPLSVQIELMRDLVAGRAPPSFLLFDKTSATEYNYTREHKETLDTPLGKLDTIIYRSDRPGSDRVTRLWLAQSLGFLPVKAERRSHNSVDFALQIRELKRPAAAPERG